MHGCSGCLGCCTRPTVINSASKPSKELGVRDRTARNPSLSEDFWTTSMCDMDNSTAQSQGSISSISMNNQILDTHGVAGNANAPSEFVNHGLLLWNQTRQRWLGNKRSENRASAHQVREPKLNHCLCVVKKFWLCSSNVTYESLLGSNKPFPQPIPLSEMVDFLVDIWEQEGMYD